MTKKVFFTRLFNSDMDKKKKAWKSGLKLFFKENLILSTFKLENMKRILDFTVR